MTDSNETITISCAEYERLVNDSLALLSRPALPFDFSYEDHPQIGSCAVCGRTNLLWYHALRLTRADPGAPVEFETIELVYCEHCDALMNANAFDAVKLMRAELLRQPIRRGGLPL